MQYTQVLSSSKILSIQVLVTDLEVSYKIEYFCQYFAISSMPTKVLDFSTSGYVNSKTPCFRALIVSSLF